MDLRFEYVLIVAPQVSVDVGEFEETMRCYHRLLDLKKKWADAEVILFKVNCLCFCLVQIAYYQDILHVFSY